MIPEFTAMHNGIAGVSLTQTGKTGKMAHAGSPLVAMF